MSGHNLEKAIHVKSKCRFFNVQRKTTPNWDKILQIRVFFLRSWFISFTCMFGEEYNIFYLIWWRNSLLSNKTYWSSFILCAYVSTCMFALSLTLFYSKCYSDRLYFCGWIDFFWFWTVTAYTYNLGQINENAIFFIKRLYL